MKPRWSSSFMIKKIMSEGATRLTNLDGEEMLCPINMDRLLQCFILFYFFIYFFKKLARLKTRKGS